MTRETACGFCKFLREVLSIKSYSTELSLFPLYSFLFSIYFKTKNSKMYLKGTNFRGINFRGSYFRGIYFRDFAKSRK